MDYETIVKIRKSSSGRKIHDLGRRVKRFDSDEWDSIKIDIMLLGIIEKFDQNPKLKEYLLKTKGRYLVSNVASSAG